MDESASPVAVRPRPAPLIVIDAGHGGKDQGTHSEKKGSHYEEKVLNLHTAKLVDYYLRSFGYNTLMTRKNDTFLELQERVKIANNNPSKLFVSVHYNSAPSEKAEGVEVYYYDAEKNKKRTEQSKALGEIVLKQIVETSHAKSRGVRKGNYVVIRETTMPAILVEGGFLTNKQEREKILKGNYMQQLAFGIAKGIDIYLKQNILGAN